MYANKLNNKNTDHKNKFIIPIDKFRYEMDTSLKKYYECLHDWNALAVKNNIEYSDIIKFKYKLSLFI